MDLEERISKRVDEQKKAGENGLWSWLALLKILSPSFPFFFSLTPELTVSILRLLCSRLILIPGLLRSANVARCGVL